METWAPALAFAVVFIPGMIAIWIQHKLYAEQIEDQREISQEMSALNRAAKDREDKRGPI